MRSRLGKVREPAGYGQRVQYCRTAPQLEASRCLDHADHGYLEAVHFPDNHRDFRVRDERHVAFREHGFQLHRRQTSRLQIVDERQRNPAVGTHLHGSREVGVLPDDDVEDVFGANAILVERRDGLHRGGRTGLQRLKRTLPRHDGSRPRGECRNACESHNLSSHRGLRGETRSDNATTSRRTRWSNAAIPPTL